MKKTYSEVQVILISALPADVITSSVSGDPMDPYLKDVIWD